MQIQNKHSVNSGKVKLVSQKFKLCSDCLLEEYSIESRGWENISEVSTEGSASFSKEVPKHNNSNSIEGQ